MQNKLHWAVTRKTAAEIIAERADATKPANAGSVSAEVARRLAEEQFATFRVQQDRRFESDFEKEVKRIQQKKDKGDAQ